MKPGFALSIPNPCSEDWKTFTPTATGGFCGRCQKNVIDFTKATNDEIIAFISKKPEHACAKFRSDQLTTYAFLSQEKIKPGFKLLKTGTISLMLLLISKPSIAQIPVVQSNYQTLTHTEKSKATSQNFVITGVVKDQDQYPVPGVSVIQKGTINGTQTDGNGEYTITLQSGSPNILVFSYISLKTQEVTVDFPDRKLEIVMQEDYSQFAGELVIAGEVSCDSLYAERPSGLKKLWNKVKNLF